MPSEESSCLGLGATILVLLGSVGLLLPRHQKRALKSYGERQWPLAIASLIALLAPICLVSSEGIPRLIAPLIPSALILPLGSIWNLRLSRSFYWRWGAVVSAYSVIPALILSPARPLFPWRALFTTSDASKPNAAARAARVYSIYTQRSEAFAPLQSFFPVNSRTIDLISFGDEPETSLWRPFGLTSVRHLLKGSNHRPGATVVVCEEICQSRFGMSVSDFAAANGLRILGSSEIRLRASGGEQRWYVLARAH